MKKEDLQIGDIVYYPCGYDTVREIREIGIIGSDPLRGIVSWKEVEPVVMNGMMACKLGFRHPDEESSDYTAQIGEVKISLTIPDKSHKEGYVSISTDGGRHINFNSDDYELCFHQIQHAFRIIGMSSILEQFEIELLKTQP